MPSYNVGLKACPISAVAPIPEIDVRVDGQRAGLPGLRGVYVRLDLVDGAHSRGLRHRGASPKDADG